MRIQSGAFWVVLLALSEGEIVDKEWAEEELGGGG